MGERILGKPIFTGPEEKVHWVCREMASVSRSEREEGSHISGGVRCAEITYISLELGAPFCREM